MTYDDAYVRLSAYVDGTHEDHEAPLAVQTSLRKLNPPLFAVLYEFSLYWHTWCKEYNFPITCTRDTSKYIQSTPDKK